MARRERGFLGLYDRPLWRDWLAWVTLLALAAGVAGAFQPHETVYGPDLIFIVVFQFALFGFVPTQIRRLMRARRSHRCAGHRQPNQKLRTP